MPYFKFRAIDGNGNVVEEKMEADSMDIVVAEITRRNLSTLEIKEVSSLITMLNPKSVSKKDLANFCKQLGYLIETGVAIHKGVEIISEQIRNPYFKSIIGKIVKDIKEGIPLSQAVSKYPKVFTDAIVFQLRAAESGGFMQDALFNIAASLERDAKFSKQVKGAMIYPIVVLIVSFLIVYLMLAFVVPKMTKTLSSFDAELPQITQFVMKVSDLVTGYWYIGVGAGLGIFFLVRYLLKNEENHYKLDKFMLKIPVIGNLIIAINVARMTRVMAALLSSGVPIDDTLENLKNILSNRVMSGEISKVRTQVVEDGYTLSDAMNEKPVFPKALVQILKVGEETGNLEEVLVSLADKYEEDVSDALRATTNLINPILMIFIGAIVAVIVLSLFLPMFSLIDNL
ncbi:type II secretion system F family protein [Priestia filamentosa]|uniref:type II secretion system F family protein n=1 Tax=Priestia filamentosa TaxID=1402861 RepID=UPI000588EB0E